MQLLLQSIFPPCSSIPIHHPFPAVDARRWTFDSTSITTVNGVATAHLTFAWDATATSRAVITGLGSGTELMTDGGSSHLPKDGQPTTRGHMCSRPDSIYDQTHGRHNLHLQAARQQIPDFRKVHFVTCVSRLQMTTTGTANTASMAPGDIATLAFSPASIAPTHYCL